MKAIILLFLLFLSSDSLVENNDLLTVVKFGSLISETNLIEIFHKNHNSLAKLNNCQIIWNAGDAFYIVEISNDESYAIKKSTYDSLYKKYQNDEKISQFLTDNGQICEFEIVESY